MTGRPLFLGPEERRRFAVLHEPAEPRGAVLICPPLGYEAVCAHASLRQVAEQLEARGITVMRMEYDGTGNSVGTDRDPDRVPAWLDSVVGALDHLRGRGYEQITLVGLRMGALLATLAAQQRDDVRHLVLWDPVVSGRRYSRRLSMLATGETGGREGDDVLVAGLRFTGPTLRALSKVKMPPTWPGASTLVIEPTDYPGDDLGSRTSAPGVVVEAMGGTTALLDTDAELSVVPVPIVQRIVAWVDHETGPDEAPQRLLPEESPTVAVERVGADTLVHEAVRIGPSRLFAIHTWAQGTRPSRAVVMLNNGAAPQLGPGRAWVEWAADLCTDDWSVLRLDFNGLGDSPPVGDATTVSFYPLQAGRDIAEAARYARDLGAERVALLGLCSGALLSFDAMKRESDIDAVACINARFDMPWWFDPKGSESVRAAGRTTWLAAFALRRRKLFPLFDRVPYVIWHLLDLLGVAASPARMLDSARGHRAKILLLFGSEELGLKALLRRGGRPVDRALRSEQYTLTEVPGMDHSMFLPGFRDSAYAVVRAFLEEEVPSRRRLDASDDASEHLA